MISSRRLKRALNVLYVCVPLAFVFEWAWHPSWHHTALFICSALGIIPLAGLMGHATEDLAAKTGPAIGAFLNAALGNAAELIIALVGLFAGKYAIVQASLTGSIIGNILFILGLSSLLGGARRTEQKFSKVAAESGVAMLYVCVAGLSIPSILAFFSRISHRDEIPADKIHAISVATAVVLLLVYAASLLFAFRTHKHVFTSDEETEEHAKKTPMAKILAMLIGSAVLIGFLAEFLTGSVDHAAQKLGFSEVFVGVVIVAIVGNAAEHAAAVVFAMKDKMNLSMNIAIESSKQIALFIAPVVVIVGAVSGHPISLDFSMMEVAAIGMSVIILAMLILDGRTNWLEGAMLLALYAILAVAFYYSGSGAAPVHGAPSP